ncbi:hypothetical protein WJX72_000302 [[Myrmecia] bisecta]|uniref:Cyclin C-terminal domain-containing protein n=1 Tax=[Myrmecia] bisecta TaxID=41462 RepID=A0AAW1PE32_9CHLO
MQRVVNARHRMVLTEWLAEVSWDWNLESTIVFKAVSYLDHYLGVTPVEVLSRFQLVGIACLRAAMGDTRKRLPIKLQDQDKDLDPQRFAYISDRTYTPEEVEEFTTVIANCTPEHVKDAPNPKMFLRSFWYRTVSSGLVTSEEMHIYTIASFFLQLSLLDLTCTGYSASLLAASALSNSLHIFGKESWPVFLQQYAAYTSQELAPCKANLFELEAKMSDMNDPIDRWRSDLTLLQSDQER